MSYDDKDLGEIFPTRQGTPAGSSLERKMLDNANNTTGFTTRYRPNDNGGYTMLRTRGGWPEFTTFDPPKIDELKYRGFVAVRTGYTKGVTFDPWVPEVEHENYALVRGTYEVQKFWSGYNETLTGIKYNDVVSLIGGVLYVNGGRLPAFSAVVSSPYQMVPYVICTGIGSGIDNYGADSSRVFCVGRDRVLSVTDSTSIILFPKSPRLDEKSMTCGPLIDSSSDTAILSQFYFTGDDLYSINAGWVFSATSVSMQVVAPRLSDTNQFVAVDQPSIVPQFVGATSGTVFVTEPMPSIAVFMLFSAQLGSSVGPYNEGRHVNYVAVECIQQSLTGTRSNARSGAKWETSFGESVTVAGESATIRGTVNLVHENRAETLYAGVQNITTPASSKANNNITTDLRWGGAANQNFVWEVPGLPNLSPSPQGPRGTPVIFFPGADVTDVGCYFEHNYQQGDFEISVGADRLLSVSFEWLYELGNTVVAHPVDWMTQYLGEVDDLAHLLFQANNEALNSAIVLSRTAEMSGMVQSKAAEWVGAPYYSWDYVDAGGPGQYFTGTIEPRTFDYKHLNWTTRDFVLLDKSEDVRISVRGEFNGDQGHSGSGSADLYVYVDIASRFGNATSLIYSTTFGYTDLLPREELTTGVEYVPSPKLRLIYTPLHRGQGGFHGAAYTTLEEESDGVSPACAINFTLGLGMHGLIGAVDQINSSGAGVVMIPFNLLEMLYAYVFSQDYGQNGYERYPAPFWNRFQKVERDLFGKTYHVHFVNGQNEDWVGDLGAQFVGDKTTMLSRT